jgi:hypothetical protein
MIKRKRKIKAATIIRDIRSGITVSQLMEKYGISSRGLRIVLRKLLNGRAITKEELGGDTALYRDTLVVKGIRRWLRQATIFQVRVYDSGNPSAKGTIRDISEKGVCVEGIEAAVGEVKNFIVRSGAFGEGHTAVFEAKCRWVNKEESFGKKWVAGFEITSISSLDARELQKLMPASLLRTEATPVVLPKRKISAKSIVRDIRAGLSGPPLLEKYELSPAGLEKILRKLLDARAITSEELGARFASLSDLDGLDYLRESTPEELICLVPVYEESVPDTRGTVCELTERSLCVTGIETAVDEIKTLVIPADEFFSISPFSFEATCRWVERQAGDGESVAGFAIRNISGESHQRLQKLIRLIKLPE